MRTGTLYGVGVGPGDPELMTLKAISVLKAAAVIAVPSSSGITDGSQALAIVKKSMDISGKEILPLLFPMTKDSGKLEAARIEAASLITGKLRLGMDVAFITLGDPLLYSTFSYLVPFVRDAMPEAAVKLVPGITSFSAAASAAGSVLAETDERVIIVPAAYDLEKSREALRSADTVVFMKVNRNIGPILDLIEEAGHGSRAVFVSRAGWPEEEIITDMNSLRGRQLDYFSLLIVRKTG